MVLSKAAFFHRKYLDMYTYKMPSTIHDYVTRERSAVDSDYIFTLVLHFHLITHIWSLQEL